MISSRSSPALLHAAVAAAAFGAVPAAAGAVPRPAAAPGATLAARTPVSIDAVAAAPVVLAGDGLVEAAAAEGAWVLADAGLGVLLADGCLLLPVLPLVECLHLGRDGAPGWITRDRCEALPFAAATAAAGACFRVC